LETVVHTAEAPSADELSNTPASCLGLRRLARIEIAREAWDKAAALLVDATERLRTREDVSGESTAQAFAALVYSAQGKLAERDQAAGRARELRARITTRQNAFPIDIALAQLSNADTHSQVSGLLALAAEAEERQWLAQSLEAKYAAWQILDRNHDAAAPRLREQILTVADEHGFGWLQARLQPAAKP